MGVEDVRDTWDGVRNTAVTVSRSEAEFITPAHFEMNFQLISNYCINNLFSGQ